jgi:predicted transposase YdaD
MSYVTSWEQFAREEGVAEGRKEGRQEGEAHALLRQLEVKFGPPSAELATRVRSAPPEQLDVWLTRILTANSIEQVFDPS